MQSADNLYGISVVLGTLEDDGSFNWRMLKAKL